MFKPCKITPHSYNHLIIQYLKSFLCRTKFESISPCQLQNFRILTAFNVLLPERLSIYISYNIPRFGVAACASASLSAMLNRINNPSIDANVIDQLQFKTLT